MAEENKRVRAWVEAAEGEAVEGHYYAPDASFFRLVPSEARCPFCFSAMEAVVGHFFGRIFRDLEQRHGRRTCAVVELLPPTHEALKCSSCDMVLTRVK